MSEGRIYITSSGYDPERGRQIKDPFLGATPTLGACRPDIRRLLVPGDLIFVVSGSVPGIPQFIFGGFEVAEKIDAMAAYRRFPALRLHRLSDGQIRGNIIVDARGKRHQLDTHEVETFERRIVDYVVGKNPIALVEPDEIARARDETVQLLRDVLGKPGTRPIDIMGRASKLDHQQAGYIQDWMRDVKRRRR